MPRTTIFTCSIYPDLTRVWFHFVQRYTDAAQVQAVIYDCGSRLDPRHFPGAKVKKHRNLEHGKKIDHYVQQHQGTPLIWLSDDDVFMLSGEAEPRAAEDLLGDERRAALSYKPRGWWEFEIDGLNYPVMGSYCLIFKPEIFTRENLSFCTRPNTNPKIRQGMTYYDTADYANEQLLRRGYEVINVTDENRQTLARSYSAVSSGFVNFAQRGWFASAYRLRHTRSHWADAIRKDLRSLERACGVAGITLLYRQIFREEPLFQDFFTPAELADLAADFSNPAQRAEAGQIVAGYNELLQTLQAAAA